MIGAGHNGLVAAALLARRGHSVRVFERREQLGGAYVTEELWPGFRTSRAAYVVGLLRPVVQRELDLGRRSRGSLPPIDCRFTACSVSTPFTSLGSMPPVADDWL